MSASPNVLDKSSSGFAPEASSAKLPNAKPSVAFPSLEHDEWMDQAMADMERMSTDEAFRRQVEQKLLRQ